MHRCFGTRSRNTFTYVKAAFSWERLSRLAPIGTANLAFRLSPLEYSHSTWAFLWKYVVGWESLRRMRIFGIKDRRGDVPSATRAEIAARR
jgi:hypothetical protein